jgi:hypothetical protein
LHVVPLAHAAHATPPVPHALSSVPGSHTSPEQQPVQEVASQTHVPAEQV